MSEVFYCPTDEDSFDDLRDAIGFVRDVSSNKEDALGWVIDVHKKLNPTHNSFVDGQGILENISSRAYDEYSEHAEDYLNDVIYDKDKAAELEKIITEWLENNADSPGFYQSAGKVEEIIVDDALLNKYGIEF